MRISLFAYKISYNFAMFKKHVTESFSLANKNLEIYLIGIFILIAQTIIARFNNLLSFLTIFIVSGFYASIPLFIDVKVKNKVFNLKEVFVTSMKNSGRLIIPIILAGVTILILFFGLMFVLGVQKTQEILGLLMKENLRLGILFILFSPFAFASIYFSIENMGILKSFGKSFNISMKNPKALFLIVMFSIVGLVLRSFILSLYANEFGNFTFGAITQYFGLLIASYTLLIYRKRLSY